MKTIDSNLLRNSLLETFANSEIPTSIDELKIGDFEEWDSLGNFNLLLDLEKKLGIQFNLDEMANIRSIADIKSAINSKL
jgi:acyl carrier protein